MEEEREITILIDCTKEELLNIFQKNNYNYLGTAKYYDIYMTNNNIDVTDELDLLKRCVILRQMIIDGEESYQILYKNKSINKSGEITSQKNIKINIDSIENSRMLFEKIGFHTLIEIEDNIEVYSNGKYELAVQHVNNKHIYIELEDHNQFSSIKEMKKVLIDLAIPIKNNDFFAKKALIELKERYFD